MNACFASNVLGKAVVDGNDADFYGGISSIASSLDLLHVTISNNHANVVIGGLSGESSFPHRTATPVWPSRATA